jgi:hypothetical protein
MKRILIVLLLIVMATPAAAQKRCVKGIPCGNSCIAANKTCRIGAPSTPSTPRVEQGSVGKADTSAIATSGDWVGSSRGTTYYRAGCSGAKKLSPANLIYFKSEDEAKKAGYTRSSQRGC